jgi:hypothetical protein
LARGWREKIFAREWGYGDANDPKDGKDLKDMKSLMNANPDRIETGRRLSVGEPGSAGKKTVMEHSIEPAHPPSLRYGAASVGCYQ